MNMYYPHHGGRKKGTRLLAALCTLPLCEASGPLLLDGDRHRAILMGKRLAAGRIEFPGDAPAILAELGLAAGELDTGAVPVSNIAGGIGKVDGHVETVERHGPGVTGEGAQHFV